MARKMSKAAKAEAYDALADLSELQRLALSDIMSGRNKDADITRRETVEGTREEVYARGVLFRATGAAGGIVVLSTWTADEMGAIVSTPDVSTHRLDDLLGERLGDRYHATAYGRSVAAVLCALRSQRSLRYAQAANAD